MRARSTTPVAWSLCVTAIIGQGVGWVLVAVNDEFVPVFGGGVDVVLAATMVVLPLVGALVASRRPANAIGWLFCGCSVLLALAMVSYAYAAYALLADPVRPGGVESAWLMSWVFLPAVFGAPPMLFLLFPEGRPLSRRWRWAVVLTVTALLCQTTAAAFRPGPIRDAPLEGVQNPVGLRAGGLIPGIEVLGWTLTLASIALAATSLVLRRQRAHGTERLQLRWFFSSAALFVLGCLLGAILLGTGHINAGPLLIFTTFCTIPIATGVAVLKYRLYDIDVVINRTLVYGTLSATLLAVYLGSVLVLQLVLRPLTDRSDLAVAVSTLAVAALVRPARRRIQGAVDRRFYRRRYDAARTMESFGGRLRQEVDLESVCADLRGVVRDTVQPAHVSLWIRP
jgi:hypothetical protein